MIFQKAVCTFLLFIAIVIFVGLFSLPTSHAAFNPEINYQAKLTASTSIAVSDGGYNIRFKLYTVPVGGSPVWTETWCYSPDGGATCNGTGVDNRVFVSGGLLSTLLGSTTDFTGVDFNQTLYLGVEIGDSGTSPSWDGEMTPRKKIGSVPSAFVAQTLNGFNDTQFIRSDTTNATSSTNSAITVTQNGAGNIANFIGPASAPVLVVRSSGNVGIGTTTPGTGSAGSKLDVVGNIGIDPAYVLGSGKGFVGGANAGASSTLQLYNANTGNTIINNQAFDFNFTANTGNLLTIKHSGNVGIGTTTPAYKLDTYGRINADSLGGNGGYISTGSYGGTGNAAYFPSGIWANGSTNWIYGLINTQGNIANTSNKFLISPTANSYINSGFNFGVGSSTPWADFSIAGSALGTNPIFAVSTSTSVSTTTVFMIDSNGRVGIGTTSPTYPVDIYTTNSSALRVFKNSTVVDSAHALFTLEQGGTGDVGLDFVLTNSQTWRLGIDNSTSDKFIISSGPNFSANTRMTIDPNGNVGIGTTSPYEKLSVSGNGVFSGGNVLASYYIATSTTVASVFPYASTTALTVSTTASTTNLLVSNNANFAGGIWNSSGNVGIGATSPNAKLEIAQSGSDTLANRSHLIFGGSSGTTNYFQLGLNATGGLMIDNLSGTPANVMTLLNSGNVGIGSTSPSQVLSVLGNSYISGTSFFGGAMTGASTLAIGGATTLSSTLNVTGLTTLGFASTTQISSTGSAYFATAGGNVGIGTTTPVGKLSVNAGDILLSHGANYGVSGRYGGLISLISGIKGRQINNNPDFLYSITDVNSRYLVYDNGASGSITLSLVDGSTTPSSSGRVMQIDHTNTGSPTPGIGGFYKSYSKCVGVAVGQCYREGARIVNRIWAKIPVGFTISFASNGYGTGGNYQWITPTAGTGSWEEYIGVQTIGVGGSLSSTGYWYLIATTGSRPTSWQVAVVDLIDIDSVADVDRASKLNVGYKTDISLAGGSLLTTNTTLLAIDSGNVGIGTTSPFAKLSVGGTTFLGGNLTATGTVAFTALSSGAMGIGANGSLYSFSTSTWSFASSTLLADWNNFSGKNTFAGATTTFTNGISVAGSSGLTVLSNGKVGIGTTSPLVNLDISTTNHAALHVYKNNATIDGPTALVTLEQGGTGDVGMDFLLSGGQRWRMGIDNSTSDKFVISSGADYGSNARLTIDTTGSIGVGSSTPWGKLSASSTSAFPAFAVQQNSTGAAAVFLGGNVGIGISNPTQALNVSGNGLFTGTIIASNLNQTQYSFAVPSSAGDAIGFATVTNANFSSNVEIWLTIHSSGYAQSKRYIVPVQYNGTAGVWQKALPISTTGIYSGNDAEVDVMISNSIASFRLRRTAGATAGTATITLAIGGDPAGTTVTATSSAFVAPSVTANYAPTSLTMKSGKTGINNDSPTAYLDVIGTTEQNRLGYDVSNYLSTTISAAGFANFNAVGTAPGFAFMGGNFGIGTTSPFSVLSASSSVANPTAYFKNMNASGGSAVAVKGESVNTGAALGAIGYLGGYDSVLGKWFGVKGNSDASGHSAIIGTASTGAYAGLFLGGNVGIGTTTPGYKLDVYGVANIGDIYGTIASPQLRINGGGGAGATSTMRASSWSTYYGDFGYSYNGSAANSSLYLDSVSNSGAGAISLRNNGIEAMRVHTNGYVGIGTTSPGTALEVKGVINSNTGFRYNFSAVAGNYLRGDGTNFVSSAIVAGDVPTLNQNTTGSAYYVTSRDTRNVADLPQDFGPLVKFDFKTNATSTLNDGGTYAGIMTWRPYGSAGDFSGGPAMQIGNTANGNLWTRSSTGATTWGTWLQILNSSTGVTLQSATPGTAQTGNVNVSGTGLFATSVGIGTSSPFAKLSVGGDAYIGGNFTATGTATIAGLTTLNGGLKIGVLDGLLVGTAGTVSAVSTSSLGLLGSSTVSALTTNYLPKWGGSSFGNSAIYDNAGNVGIGTTTPNAKLNIFGASSATGPGLTAKGSLLVTNATDASTGLSFGGYGSPSYGQWIQAMDGRTGFATTYSLSLNPIGGNVGIGTTTPTTALQVGGILGQQFNVDVGTANYVKLSADRGLRISSNAGYSTSFMNGALTYMTIDGTTGNVGIGTTSPYSILSISNSASTAANTPLFTIASTTAGNSTTTLMTVLANGNVGIGTTAPAGKLDIRGLSTGAPSATLTAGDLVVDTANKNVYIGRLSDISGDNTNFTFRDRIGGVKSYWENASSGSVSFGNFGTNYGLSIAPTALGSGATTAARLVVDSGASSFPSAVFTTGNVGIGTTSPYASLSVNGRGIFNQDVRADYFTSTSTTATSTLPNLSIANMLFGSDYLSDITGSGLTITNGALTVTGSSVSGAANMLSAFDASGNITSTSTPSADSYLATSTTATSIFAGGLSVAGSSGLMVLQNGDVGIGTTSPFAKLSVGGTTFLGGNLTATGTVAFTALSSGAMGIGANGSLYSFSTSTWTFASSTLLADWNTFSGKNTFAGATTTFTNGISVAGSSGLTVLSNGKVGIGTTSPLVNLDISTTNHAALHVYKNNATTDSPNALVTLEQGGTGDVGLDFLLSGGQRWRMGVDNSTSDKFVISSGADFGANARMTIDTNGNVGIGTVYPVGVLDVAGGAISTSTIAMGDADLTELAGYFENPYVSLGEYQNFLTQTEAFGTTPWVSTAGTIISDRAISPDGTLIAEYIPVGADAARGVSQTITNSMLGNLNFSVWLKASTTAATVKLRIDTGNGSATTTGTEAVFSLANGWKRYSVTQNVLSAHTLATVVINSGTNSVIAWGAQLEQSTTSRVYSGALTTTAVPALTRTLHFRGAIATNSSFSAGAISGSTLALTSTLSGATTIANAGTITNTMTTLATSTLNIANGLRLINSTAATALLNGQQAPRIIMEGNVWDGSATRIQTWNIAAMPFENGNRYTSATSTFEFNYAYNGLATTTVLSLNSSGNVGIGTTSPYAKLSVMQTLGGTSPLFLVASSTNGLSTSTVMIINKDGKIGIGTSSPAVTLDIATTNHAGLRVLKNNSTTDSPNALVTLEQGGAGDVGLDFLLTGGQRWRMGIDNSTSDKFVISSGADFGNSSRLVIDTTGNVGIGTTTPTSKFVITSDGSVPTFADTTNSQFVIDGATDSRKKLAIGVNTSASTMYSYIQSMEIGTSARDLVLNERGGNVGIGTTSPYAALTVNGRGIFNQDVRADYFTSTSTTATSTLPNLSITNLLLGSDFLSDITGSGLTITNGALSVTGASVSGAANMLSAFDASGNLTSTSTPSAASYLATSTTATSTFAGGLRVAGTSGLNVLSNGKVGIGTAAPWQNLTVSNNSATIPGFSVGYDSVYNMGFGYDAGGSTKSYIGNSTNDNAARFDFRMKGFADANTVMTILGTGNVGIGTTSPGELLELSKGATGNSMIKLTRNSLSSYIGVGDANYGFTGIAAGDLAVQAKGALWLGTNGNNPRLVIDTAGNVGIGTSSPGAPFHVSSNSATGMILERTAAASNSNIQFKNASGSMYAGLSDSQNFGIGSGAALSTAYLTVASGGNVGIGTVAPNGLLQVGNNLTATTLFLDSQSGYSSRSSKQWNTYTDSSVNSSTWTGGVGLNIHNDDTTDGNWSRMSFSTYEGATGNNVAGAAIGTQFTGRAVSGWAYGDLAFFTNPKAGLLERMRIGSTGNVGIGTTSPAYLTHLYASSPTLAIDSSSNTGLSALKFYESNNMKSFIQWRQTGNAISNLLQIGTISAGAQVALLSGNNAEAVRISSTGSVGVGTTTPEAKVDVLGVLRSTGSTGTPVSGTGIEMLYQSGGFLQSFNRTAGTWQPITVRGSTATIYGGNGASGIDINTLGNVGIGTTSPYAKLSVAGNAVMGTTTINGTINATSQLTWPVDQQTLGGSFNVVGVSSGGSSTYGRGYDMNLTTTGTQNMNKMVNAINTMDWGSSGTLTLGENSVQIGKITSSGNVSTMQIDRAYLQAPVGSSGSFGDVYYYMAESPNLMLGAGSITGTSIAFNCADLSTTTMTNDYCFSIYDQTKPGSGNTVGLISGMNAAANGKKWNIYQYGTAPNYFNGKIGIGTTTPARSIDISDNSTSLTTLPAIRMSYNAAPGIYYGELAQKWNGIDGAYGSNGFRYAFTVNDAYGGGTPIERLTIQANGNVGLGTTSPDKNLVVSQSTNPDTEMVIESNFNAGDSSGAKLVFRTPYGGALNEGSIRSSYWQSPGMTFTTARDLNGWGFAFNNKAGSRLMYINSTDGNVGIGTSSPYQKLSVAGNVIADRFIATSTASSTFAGGIDAARFCITGTNTCLGAGGAGSGTVNSGAQGQIAFYNSNGTAVSGTSTIGVASTGFVGINNSNPVTNFVLSGEGAAYKAQMQIIDTADTAAGTGGWGAGISIFGSDAGANNTGRIIFFGKEGGGSNDVLFRNEVASDFRIQTAGQNRLLLNNNITNKGQLTIIDDNHTAGHANMAAALSGYGSDIGSGSTGRSWYVGNDGGAQQFDIFYQQNAPMSLFTNATERLTIAGGGNVGIGTSTPGTLLSINGVANFTTGTSTIYQNLVINGTGKAKFWYTGDLFFANNFSFTEAPYDIGTTTQALILKNQKGQPVMTMDEYGNLAMTGDVCAKNSVCYGKSIEALTSAISAIGSTTDALGSTASEVATLTNEVEQMKSSLVSNTEFVANLSSRVASSTAAELTTGPSSFGFISAIANAVQVYIQSLGNWMVDKLSAKIVYSDRIETKVAAISEGLEMTDKATGQIYCVTIENGDWKRTLGACVQGSVSTTTPFVLPSITPTPSPSSAPIITLPETSPMPIVTSTPTSTPTTSPTPTTTPVVSPTPTASSTDNIGGITVPTPSPSVTPESTISPTPSVNPTPTSTETPTLSPSSSPVTSPTAEPSSSQSPVVPESPAPVTPPPPPANDAPAVSSPVE